MMEHSEDLGQRKLAFYETLREILPPKSQSDQTCYRRLTEWLAAAVREGRQPLDVFQSVILLARESATGKVRNPRAVFMANLRKEIGYVPKRTT